MIDKSNALSTEELWTRLLGSKKVEDYLGGGAAFAEEISLPALQDYLADLCEMIDEKPEQILRRGDIESSYGHRIFAGARNPSRDTVLKLAFGFGLDVDETQQLLKVARLSALHPKVKRDAVIAFCLHNGKNIVEVQQYLYDNELPLLGGNRHA